MIQKVKGTYDILPEEYPRFDKVETLFRHFLDLYGYQEMKTPVFENTAVFQKENETSDMVSKEMYSFTVNGRDSLTLRPEGTAGIIRSFVENKMYGTAELPVKLAYVEEMFRHERPQKGRQRQFTQMGIENIGNKSPLIDAEVIALGYSYIRALGIQGIKVLVNTLGDNASRVRYKEALKDYFEPHREELCGDCQKRLEKNPLRILDCKIDHDLEAVKNAPKMSDYLTEEADSYFKQVLIYLDALEIPYEIDDRLVRGLDYYTDTVFEVVSTNPESGSQATIFGGGRYDNLVASMGGPSYSGIGFAIGVERLLILMEAEGLFEEAKKTCDVYVIDMTKGSSYALEIATVLRAASYRTELNVYERSLKSQFKSADRYAARFTVILGEDELRERSVTLKDARTKSQYTMTVEELVPSLDELMEDNDE
ncbi:MAG: histidine--tRNA ligase [Erysipelotrichaceae bacterium]|nr:histidine--tRNA ligase [Erysipelotrichaceae bacterium]